MRLPSLFCPPRRDRARVPAPAAVAAVAAVGATLLLFGPAVPAAFAAPAYTFSTLISFDVTNGSLPLGGLVRDAAGNLYGTTAGGGANFAGTVFKLTMSGGVSTLTTLASFDGTNGSAPSGILALDADGNLYGTTQDGGADDAGTVFKVTTSGGVNTLTTLVSFDSDDASLPYGGLVLDADGDLYGTTIRGGANGRGTVFKVSTSGGVSTLSTLASFGVADGRSPYSGLVLDADGDLYGTTYEGGPVDAGTVFKVSTSGGVSTLSTLVALDGTNGRSPDIGRLALDADGDLYGTAIEGGANGQGTVFKVSTSGGVSTLSTLATFDGANGAYPFSGLVRDAEGNLYGMTAQGGTNDAGTVFLLDPEGTFTTLYSFDGADSPFPFPYADLTLDDAGNLYGVTYRGGANDVGTVFKLSVVGAASAPEPGSVALLLTAGLPVIGVAVRRRRGALVA